MIKPKHLEKGDAVAIVSLSRGTLGEDWAIHKLAIARERLERDYGLQVRVMPNALKGIDYLDRHPEARAEVQKVSSALYRRGYSWETIRSALRRYTDLDEE